MKFVFIFFLFLFSLPMNAQENTIKLPYDKIPDAPELYTPGTVVARMIDGLAFRYRWATENLTEENLDYKPGNDGRSIRELIDHLYGLSQVISNSAKKIATDRTVKAKELTYLEKRIATLNNFKMASKFFAKTEDLTAHKIIFKRANGTSEFPFWNNINGPIEDAVWHAGQIVLLRRSAGNPINPKVNVFLGKLND